MRPAPQRRLAAHEFEERPAGSSDPGSVVLDIGGDVGALVVRTPSTLLGAEIEIRADGASWLGAHTAVRRRRFGSHEQYAGIFPWLDAGSYELRLVGDTCADGLRVRVRAGQATEAWFGSSLG